MIKVSRVEKILIIECIVIILIVGCVFLWRFPGMPFITQSVENIERIAIVVHPSTVERERTIYIYEREKVEHIHRILSRTAEVRVRRNPEHPGAMPCISRFILRIEYYNEEVGVFFSTEGGNHIFRFLDSTGRRGYQGFVIGRNPRLVVYIENLINTEVKNEFGLR